MVQPRMQIERAHFTLAAEQTFYSICSGTDRMCCGLHTNTHGSSHLAALLETVFLFA